MAVAQPCLSAGHAHRAWRGRPAGAAPDRGEWREGAERGDARARAGEGACAAWPVQGRARRARAPAMVVVLTGSPGGRQKTGRTERGKGGIDPDAHPEPVGGGNELGKGSERANRGGGRRRPSAGKSSIPAMRGSSAKIDHLARQGQRRGVARTSSQSLVRPVATETTATWPRAARTRGKWRGGSSRGRRAGARVRGGRRGSYPPPATVAT